MSRARKVASLRDIALHWGAREDLAEVFPAIEAHWIGWGEPFCFRCGWLAPAPDPYAPRAWNAAAGWLERAHLVDDQFDGSGESANVIPLCILCHKEMPPFRDFSSAIAWIRAGRLWDTFGGLGYWQLFTDGIFSGENYEEFAYGSKKQLIREAYQRYRVRSVEIQSRVAEMGSGQS